MKIHFDIFEKGTQNLASNILYGDSETPCRAYVGFQETKALNGDYKEFFYNFKRSWTATSTGVSRSSSVISMSPQVQTITPQPNRKSFFSFLSSLRATTAEVDIESQRQSIVVPPPEQPPINDLGTTVTCYIKNCNLTLNGHSISSLGQVDASATRDVESYLQFAKTTGCLGTGFSNSISLDDYNNAYFFRYITFTEGVRIC